MYQEIAGTSSWCKSFDSYAGLSGMNDRLMTPPHHSTPICGDGGKVRPPRTSSTLCTGSLHYVRSETSYSSNVGGSRTKRRSNQDSTSSRNSSLSGSTHKTPDEVSTDIVDPITSTEALRQTIPPSSEADLFPAMQEANIRNTSSSGYSGISAETPVVEGRGQSRRQIGLASLGQRRAVLTLSQYSDTHTYIRTITKMAILNASEIIAASTLVGEPEGLVKALQESSPFGNITVVHRKYFDDAKGLAVINHVSANPHLRVSSKYYCLAAAAALLKYVEHVQQITFAPQSLHVEFLTSDNTMFIDYNTCAQLELVRSLQDGSWASSLFGCLRHTQTPAGARLLRAMILQPFTDLSAIKLRQNAVFFLYQRADLRHSLQAILKRFPDVDWLLSMCVQVPRQFQDTQCDVWLNYVVGLRNSLDLLEALSTALLTSQDVFLLASIRETLSQSKLLELRELLNRVIHEDARLQPNHMGATQRCYAIRSNINGLLDVARKVYSEIVDDVTSYVETLARHHSLNIKIGHSSSRGFHVVLHRNANKLERLPDIFIRVQHYKNYITCTTEELYQLDQRSKDTEKEILLMSNIIVKELVEDIRGHIHELFSMAEALANLDVTLSMAHTASLRNWVPPNMSFAGVALKGARHPLLDLLSSEPPVPNDIMGSFVPAECASLSIKESLFTAIECRERPEDNLSAFQTQMSDVQESLSLASSKTLVLLDEIGCSTVLDEGEALTWALLEAFLKSKALTLVGTHQTRLSNLSCLYPTSFVNFQFKCENATVKHILEKGVVKMKNYGYHVALSSGAFPTAVMDRAKTLIEKNHSPFLELQETLKEKQRVFVNYLMALAIANSASIMESFLDVIAKPYISRIEENCSSVEKRVNECVLAAVRDLVRFSSDE